MGLSNILALLGGVALFLFGMSVMGDNLKKVAGAKLEMVLFKLSSTPIKGILLGTGVTAIIQSSSATSVMVVGFVNSGMMKVKQAIGIIMGAIIGTSMTGWVISLSSLDESASGFFSLLSTDNLTAIVALIGILLYMSSKKASNKYVGAICLGFAVLMFGMKAMSGSVEGLRSEPVFLSMLTNFSSPFIGILVGILFTSVIQSASAAVGILQALSITGSISFEIALPIIMGIAIGAAVPVLLSALSAGTAGKRTAISYLIVDTLGVIIFSAVFYSLNSIIHFEFMSMTMNTVKIALLNTIFRAIIVAILTPFINILEKIVVNLVKDSEDNQEDLKDFDRLEERFLAHPAMAVEQSKNTLNSMAEKAMKNIYKSIDLLSDFSNETYEDVERREESIDKYEDKLGNYLIKIKNSDLSSGDNNKINKFLHVISDFERIGDHAINIAQSAKEKHDKNVHFSGKGKEEMIVLESAIKEILSITIDAFTNDKLSLCYKIEPLEQIIDSLCVELKSNHIDRLQKGECTFEDGFIFTDLLTNFERVADHCSNIGVAIIKAHTGILNSHEYLANLEKKHTEDFDIYYKEFSEKFNLD